MQKLAILGGIVAVTLIAAPLAIAQPPADSEGCVTARAALVVALDAVLDLSPEVLDGADSPDDLTSAALTLLLADGEAGEGAQVVIRAAIAAHATVVTACAPATGTPTPTPTDTPTPGPTPTPTATLPPPDEDDAVDGEAPPPVIVDGGVAVTH